MSDIKLLTEKDLNDVVKKSELNSYPKKTDLHKVSTSGSYNDLENKPTIPVVPTKLSEFNNDSGFINGDYDNSTSGLAATTIQGAIDELKILFDSLTSAGE